MKNATKKTIILSPNHLEPSKTSQNNQVSEPDNLKKSRLIKTPVFLISVLGTVLEYFEYAIYGFLAPILALHFFPSGDPSTALLKAFGVFAVGSLSKPLGALIFGYLGDMRGRRVSLRYSMIGISFPTFIVGMLPGYESWGWVSAFILVLCRLSQGIFLAGESDGVQIYIFEHFGRKKPCLMANLAQCGAYSGIAVASLVASQIPAQGENWRFVFLGCSILGAVVFILRRYLIETPPFLAYQQKNLPSFSLKQVVTTYWAAIARTVMICGSAGGTYHFYIVFQGAYLANSLGVIPLEQSTILSFWLASIYVLTLPFAGWAADSWGLTRIAKIGGAVALVLIVLNAVIVNKGAAFVPLMILTTISIVFFVSPGYLFLMQQYDVSVRFRCLSLGHTMGSMLFSGTTPFMCLLLWQSTSLPYIPYLYFFGLVAMGVTAFIWGEKTAKSPLPRG